jgi:quercetin dioxygenase-like cupin family protein
MSGSGPSPIRRVVTGHSPEGSSRILKDAPATNVRAGAHAGQFSTLIWCSDEMPVPIPLGEAIEDMGDRILGTSPPPNGTRFMIAEFPPGMETKLHRTDTIDFIVVLEGTITLELDDQSRTELGPGATLVQRGTNHKWINRGTTECRLAFTLVDAKPLGLGNPVSGTTTASSLD